MVNKSGHVDIMTISVDRRRSLLEISFGNNNKIRYAKTLSAKILDEQLSVIVVICLNADSFVL